MSPFVFINNQLYPIANAPYHLLQRGYSYADGCFETMLLAEGRLHLGLKHLQRLEKTMTLLQIKQGPRLNLASLEEDARELAAKNNCGEYARIKLTVVREQGGFYAPTSHWATVMMEATPHTGLGFKELFNVGISEKVVLTNHPYAAHKTLAKIDYVQAAIEGNNNGWDETFITTSQGRVVETINANIIAYYEDTNTLGLVNPLSYGLSGTMLHTLTQYAKSHLKQKVTVSDYFQVIPGKLEMASSLITCNSLGFGLLKRSFDNIYNPNQLLSLFKDCLINLPLSDQARNYLNTIE